jgi:hypothetical protein
MVTVGLDLPERYITVTAATTEAQIPGSTAVL